MEDKEIIVVDSGSTDSTPSIVSRYPVELLHIPKEEFSFGRALNLGCRASGGDFIVVVSAHVYPEKQDWLEQLLAPFSDPRVALVYGKQRGNHTTKYSEHQIFAKWFPEESNLDQDGPFCNNANAAIRKDVWRRIPYDETLTGLEDIDWAKRAMSMGYKVAYVASAGIIHVHDETVARIYNRYRREAIALKRIFPDEQFDFWDLIRLLTANILADWLHAWKDDNLLGHVVQILSFRIAQFLGTYAGFSFRGRVTSQLKERLFYPNEWNERGEQRNELKPGKGAQVDFHTESPSLRDE